MDSQEVNGIPHFDTQIKVEKFEEAFSATELMYGDIILKESPNEENALLIKQETAIFMKEENAAVNEPNGSETAVEENCSYFSKEYSPTKCEAFKKEVSETLDGLNDSKLDEIDIKVEYFDESQSIIHEEVHTMNVGQADNQPTTSRFSEKDINDDYFDEPQFITNKDIDIKTENQKEDQPTYNYGNDSTGKGEKNYSCNKCSYQTRWNKFFIRHMLLHNKASVPKYSCKMCSYKTIFEDALKGHLRTCSLICVLCQKSFNQKLQLDSHYISDHPDVSNKWRGLITHKINECTNCDYKTLRMNDLKTHLASHEFAAEQSKSTCSVCGCICSKDNFARHLRLHDSRLPFACTECDKSFNQKMQLDGHIISRHPNNDQLMSTVTYTVYQCDSCDYKTVRRRDLEQHGISCKFNCTPTHEYKLRCNVCDYKSFVKGNLIRHMRKHDVQGPLTCTECDKDFNRKIHLDSHIVTLHPYNEQLMNSVTSKLYHCESCDYKTIRRMDLKKHVVSCKFNIPERLDLL